MLKTIGPVLFPTLNLHGLTRLKVKTFPPSKITHVGPNLTCLFWFIAIAIVVAMIFFSLSSRYHMP
jgi:predicted small integral membrane protein